MPVIVRVFANYLLLPPCCPIAPTSLSAKAFDDHTSPSTTRMGCACGEQRPLERKSNLSILSRTWVSKVSPPSVYRLCSFLCHLCTFCSVCKAFCKKIGSFVLRHGVGFACFSGLVWGEISRLSMKLIESLVSESRSEKCYGFPSQSKLCFFSPFFFPFPFPLPLP